MVVKEIRCANRKHSSAEEKVRVVREVVRGEDSTAELCHREGRPPNVYYRRSNGFLEARKRCLAGNIAQGATSDEVKDAPE